VLPPLIVLGLILITWQILCSSPKSSLPAPTKVLSDSWDFIIDPFYDNGGIDKGPSGISLKASAASASVTRWPPWSASRSACCRPEHLGDAGLDPIFQVLRTIPPLAWLPLSLAGFRDAQPSRSS